MITEGTFGIEGAHNGVVTDGTHGVPGKGRILQGVVAGADTRALLAGGGKAASRLA